MPKPVNEICCWSNGEWCYAYDLDHWIEDNGVPDLQFEFPFQLPFVVMDALMDILMPSLQGKL